jgi:catechol 2,3-dioxygenase-like lactoylglutathione lyase family enzyme
MKKIIILAVMLVPVIIFSACSATDVVGKVASTSFEEMTNNLPEVVVTDEIYNGWALKSPTGERFVWSKDFSISSNPDLMMEFDAKPFIDAGLKVKDLDKTVYFYDEAFGKLMVHSELGNDKFKYDSETKPMDSFKEIILSHRDSIKYHEKLDHYGIAFGGGNMMEWAKDLTTNDKDLVFVLNPQPFIDAGVDPNNVDGWLFAKVEIKDDQGKVEQVDKLLKPFDL